MQKKMHAGPPQFGQATRPRRISLNHWFYEPEQAPDTGPLKELALTQKKEKAEATTPKSLHQQSGVANPSRQPRPNNVFSTNSMGDRQVAWKDQVGQDGQEEDNTRECI